MCQSQSHAAMLAQKPPGIRKEHSCRLQSYIRVTSACQCLSVLVPMATGDGNDNVGNFQNVVQLCSWSASSGRLQLVAMFRLAACSNQAAVVNCCATKPIQYTDVKIFLRFMLVFVLLACDFHVMFQRVHDSFEKLQTRSRMAVWLALAWVSRKPFHAACFWQTARFRKIFMIFHGMHLLFRACF